MISTSPPPSAASMSSLCFLGSGIVVGPDVHMKYHLHWRHIRSVAGIITIMVSVISFHRGDISFYVLGLLPCPPLVGPVPSSFVRSWEKARLPFGGMVVVLALL